VDHSRVRRYPPAVDGTCLWNLDFLIEVAIQLAQGGTYILRYRRVTSHKIARAVAAGALAYSLCVAYQGWGIPISKEGPWREIKIQEAIILICWTVLPPIWFWFEYFFIYKPQSNAPPKNDFDSFKYGQDLSSKIWISVVSALLVLYFGKDLSGR
jgi:hypothetical protein